MTAVRSLGLSAPETAIVALSRRFGADTFPFETSGFLSVPFQKEFLSRTEQLSVLGVILVELARSGRIDALKSVSGYDGAGQLRLLRRQAAMWDLERDFVLRRLGDAGIPSVLLKGAALRLTAYRDSAERAFGDIDVLVPRDSLERAVAALTEAGYAGEAEDRQQLYLEHHHHLILRKPQGFVVEVHWALTRSTSMFRLDPAAFLRDGRVVTTPGGTTAPVPSPEHMVLHLAQQNLEDGFSSLRRFVDVDRVVSSAADFDWPRLASESRRMGVQAVVALTLRLAEVLLDTGVPEGFIKTLGLSAPARAHLALLDPVRLLLEQRGQRRAVRELLTLWCLPDLGTRLKSLKEMGTGAQEAPWLNLAPGWFRGGAGTRLAALMKLAGYQASLYPTGLFGLGAGARRRSGFWEAARPSA